MKRLEIRNAEILTPFKTRFTSLWLEDGKISALADKAPDSSWQDNCELIDARDCYVTPGLIDLQVNGTPECDLWSNRDSAMLSRLRESMALNGITSFLPTLITNDIESLIKSRDFLVANGAGSEKTWSSCAYEARMPGIHLEGPFLSPLRPGVHPKEFIVAPDEDSLEKLISKEISLVTFAPEIDPEGKYLAMLLERTNISAGHSNASLDEANLSFERGVRLVTHIFNAMPGMHHREPGLAGAALADSRVSCCLIADGLHLSRDTVKLIVGLKGIEKTILVSDIASIGTSGGELVGSSMMLDEAVRNIVEWTVADFRQAIVMATINPARAIGIAKHIGSIEPGKLADLLIWSKADLCIVDILISGRKINVPSTCRK